MNRTYLVAATLLTGCIMPKPQAPTAVATGEQLAVVDDVKVWTTTSKEKVAETEYTDADGHVVGKGAVYQDKTTTHSMKIWYPVQGTQQLRDEDFFKIAGDQNALRQTEDMRANGEKWRTRGMVTMGAGIVGVIAGYLVPWDAAKYLLEIGGTLAVGGGYYATHYGAMQMDPETHAVDRSVAERAAQGYNSQVGRSASLGVSGRF